MAGDPALAPTGLPQRVREFLGNAGYGSAARLTPLRLGGNNRVYRVTKNGRSAVLKEYFRHPGDPRDRLGTEFGFSRFAWEHGIHCVPEPLFHDPDAGLGLYGFIEGEPILPGSVSAPDVAQALSFIADLNRFRETPAARDLPPGSEACFSLGSHLETVRRRIDRLTGIVPQSTVDEAARSFIETKLVPAHRLVEEQVAEATGGDSHGTELPSAERVLSPSDFGFHNALRRPDGALVFLDFEYAGWDDPAKLTGDFFSQVAVPVPFGFRDDVLDTIAGICRGRVTLERMRLLLPLYRIKWCCIVLNHFLPVDSGRREFAQAGAAERKLEQLHKAEALLSSLHEFHPHTEGD